MKRVLLFALLVVTLYGCRHQYQGTAIIVGRKFTDQSGKTPAEYRVYYRTVTDDVQCINSEDMFNRLKINDTINLTPSGWNLNYTAKK